MKRLVSLAFVFALAGGCKCNDGLNPASAGFRVDPQSLDFGRVLEGTVAKQTLNVIATGTAVVDVDVTVEGNAFGSPGNLEVPGGGQGSLVITFNAPDGEVTGKLTLLARGSKTPVTVALHGVGVRPKVCTPSAPCKLSNYSLEADACVESDAPDDSLCTPSSLCLQDGHCHQGQCQGTTRSCDDHDACTDDSCSEQLGCVNTPHTCPVPTQLCQVTTCDPSSGCGFKQASDLTPCGPIACDNASLCFSGSCKQVTAPNGFICAPATPCQTESSCQNGECVHPDAGVMFPSFAVALSGPPPPGRPTVLSFNNNVYFVLCGLGDGGESCALSSYTPNGFLRWTTPLDAGSAVLADVSAAGALVLEPGQVELVALGSGASTAWPVADAGVAGTAATAAEALLLTPASLSVLSDAGLSQQMLATQASVLAVDELGQRWLWDPDAGLLSTFDGDGGLVQRLLAPGSSTVATAEGAFFAGHASLCLADGTVTAPAWSDDAGLVQEPLARPVMMGFGEAVSFHRQCDDGGTGCGDDARSVWARGLSLADGGELWRVAVTDAGSFGRVEEAALFNTPNAFAVLLQRDGGAVTQTFLEAYVLGQLSLSCPFPDDLEVQGALFDGSTLWLMANRAGMGWRLERYPLGAWPMSRTGWPVSDGVSGQRRAR